MFAKVHFAVSIGLVVCLVLACAGCNPDSPDISTTEAAQKSVVSEEAAPKALPNGLTGAGKLVGSWIRTDSPYVIEIRHVADNGNLEVSYFNPNPINVGRAQTHRKGGKLEVYVQLDDVNYPGSSYTLTYDSANDSLVGVYFQAVAQETYEIAFRRMSVSRN